MLMKINKAIFSAFFLVVINASVVFAENNPLPSPKKASANTNELQSDDPPHMPAPIDQNIVYLMGAALVLGVVMIYKNKIKKASV